MGEGFFRFDPRVLRGGYVSPETVDQTNKLQQRQKNKPADQAEHDEHVFVRALADLDPPEPREHRREPGQAEAGELDVREGVEVRHFFVRFFSSVSVALVR